MRGQGVDCRAVERVRLVMGNGDHIDADARKLFVVDAHRSGSTNRFVVPSDELLTAFLEFEQAIKSSIDPSR